MAVGRQPVAAVLHHRVDSALAEVKVAVAGGQDVRVDLDPHLVDGVAVGEVELAGRGASRQPDDRHLGRLRLGCLRGPEETGQQHVVPGAPGGGLVRVVDGVDRLAFVQDQLRPRPVLHDLDVAVRRLLLVEEAAGLGRLDADRLDEDPAREHRDPEHGEDPPSRPEAGHGEDQ